MTSQKELYRYVIPKDVSQRCFGFKIIMIIFIIVELIFIIILLSVILGSTHKPSQDFNNFFIVFFTILTLFPASFYLLHRYYRNRSFEWVFDKLYQKLSYNQASPTFKELKTFDLNDIVAVIYSKKYAYSDLQPFDFYVALYFENKKRIIVYSKSENQEGKSKCIKIGGDIAKFLEKPFVYRRDFKLRFIISSIIILSAIIATLFLIEFNPWAGYLYFTFFFIIFIICGIAIGIEYKKYRASYIPINSED